MQEIFVDKKVTEPITLSEENQIVAIDLHYYGILRLL